MKNYRKLKMKSDLSNDRSLHYYIIEELTKNNYEPLTYHIQNTQFKFFAFDNLYQQNSIKDCDIEIIFKKNSSIKLLSSRIIIKNDNFNSQGTLRKLGGSIFDLEEELIIIDMCLEVRNFPKIIIERILNCLDNKYHYNKIKINISIEESFSYQTFVYDDNQVIVEMDYEDFKNLNTYENLFNLGE